MKQILTIALGVLLGGLLLILALNAPQISGQLIQSIRPFSVYSLSRQDVIARCGIPIEEHNQVGDTINATYLNPAGRPVHLMYIDHGNKLIGILDESITEYEGQSKALPCLSKAR